MKLRGIYIQVMLGMGSISICLLGSHRIEDAKPYLTAVIFRTTHIFPGGPLLSLAPISFERAISPQVAVGKPVYAPLWWGFAGHTRLVAYQYSDGSRVEYTGEVRESIMISTLSLSPQ